MKASFFLGPLFALGQRLIKDLMEHREGFGLLRCTNGEKARKRTIRVFLKRGVVMKTSLSTRLIGKGFDDFPGQEL